MRTDARLIQDYAVRPAVHRWVVANTQPHREFIVIEHLVRQGFTTYCPKVRKIVRHARKSIEVLRPLFPNYVFVGVDPVEQQWRPLLSTRGVRSIICCGDQPSYIGTDFVNALRAREMDGAIARPAIPFHVGQEVRISRGAFDGLIGTILEMDDRQRIVVLLELLSRKVKISLNAELLAEAPAK
jgi:transcriptional antiterminator RfaH